MSNSQLSWSLIVQSGPFAGQVFPVQPGTQTIGRDPGSDIYLPEHSASRNHARIVMQPVGTWIEDLGSRNGTFVNGQRVTTPTWLQPGDTVQIGTAVTLRVSPQAAPSQVSPPDATFVPGVAAPSPAPTSFSLVIQRGPQVGQVFPLVGGSQTIGRTPGNQIVIPEPTISKQHAQITVRPEGVWIQDLGSSNGTFVNGQRITAPTWLQPGDTVQVGTAVVLGVQAVPVMASVSPAAPPAVVAVQICPRCGAENRPGLRFCVQCGSPLVEIVPAVPAVPPGQPRLRRWLRASGIALLVLLLIWWLLPPAIGFVRHTTRHRPRISQSEALQDAAEIVAENYPQFADSTPVVQETEFDRAKGYRMVYTISDVVETELGPVEFDHILVVSVNAVTGEISVAISQ